LTYDPSVKSPVSDAFPPSARSWLAVARDGSPQQRRDLSASLTAIYREPLVRYLQTFGVRLEVEDVVQDLCARILDPSFLDEWQRSERPFRLWLRTAARFELMNRIRKERRHMGAGNGALADLAESDNAQTAFERSYAASLIRTASDATQRVLESQGRGHEWTLFIEHSLQGKPYAECAPPLGIPVDGARHATARVRGLMLDALRGVLSAEQVAEADFERELMALLSRLQP
jgi:DNA-directed RNA polymerase specialized sigma24 family protein